MTLPDSRLSINQATIKYADLAAERWHGMLRLDGLDV